MPWTLTDNGAEWRLALAGRLQIRHAAQLAGDLRRAAAEAPERPWRLDAAAVEDADTSILQLLGALRREAPGWHWETVSPGLSRAAAQRGWEDLVAAPTAHQKESGS